MFKKVLFIVVIILIIAVGVILLLSNKNEKEIVSFEERQESALPKTEIRVTGADSELLIELMVGEDLPGIEFREGQLLATSAPEYTSMLQGINVHVEPDELVFFQAIRTYHSPSPPSSP